MKKTFVLFALGSFSLLSADYYQSSPQQYYQGGQYPQSGGQGYYQDGRQGYYQDGRYSQQPSSSSYYQNQPQYQGSSQSYYQNQPGYQNIPQTHDQNRFDRDGYRQNQRYDNRENISDEELSKKVHDALSSGWFSKGYQNVSYEINNGNVTLRGTVEAPEDKTNLENSVRKIDGVKQVNNQVVVSGKKTAYNDQNKMKDYQEKYPRDVATTDADREINARIRDKLGEGWFTKGYENIILKTANGIVVITGVVESNDDLEDITKKVQKIEGVKNVRNQATIKNK